jgi:hypothetical protein
LRPARLPIPPPGLPLKECKNNTLHQINNSISQ